ncbi:LacI family DNA-binding transcriptional regulator [Devosia sp. Leaf64]|uniref:LacI family DNA-binding transcriptional regulator n=1 Tax=Devosia sp. Leaf64 TaxID=1736229 RepID=UPI000787F919|nr:LacI family DNA-binding transcriptional regulator [Devosia sp. Leaf64]
MATIDDVSRRAGVSRSTVSRVVAGNGYVSESKRKAIEQAIADLGYRPNTHARALRSNRSNVIGAVVVDIGTPYFASIIFGVQRAVRPSGKSLMVSSGYADEDQESRAILELIDRSCDGIVLYLEHPMRPNVVEILRAARIPVVSIGKDHCPLSRGNVVLENYQGARDAMTHLLEQGHRDIVYLSANLTLGDSQERLRGVTDALAAFDLTLDNIHVVFGMFLERFGYGATRTLIEEGRAFTAIFAGDDDIAAGVYEALREFGRSVPGDVSVMGFDDAFFAKYLTPPLSTVRQQVDALGQQAANLLLRLMDDPTSGPLSASVETSLVIRTSVAPVQPIKEVA